MSTPAAGGLLAVILAGALFVSGGAAALGYAFIFAASVVPGLPIGLLLFGPRHPAAWIGGALVGYGLTQLALWGAIATGLGSLAGFVVGPSLLTVFTVAIYRVLPQRPAIRAGAWRGDDVRALLLVLTLVPLLMGITYRNLGRQDAEGHRYYRAYFTADFLWHAALAHELGKFTLPPRNPYLAPRPMNYYWTYFLLPASAAQVATPAEAGRAVQPFLKANAILAGVLMVGALFVLVRSAVPSAGPAAAAVLLALLAASAEGWYALYEVISRGRPLDALRDMNVDAMTAWSFGGLRVDNMPRSLWYTPQHTTSIALGLAGLTIAVHTGAAAPMAAIAAAGLALGLSTTINPLLGAVASLLYGICVLTDAAVTRAGVAAVARHGAAAAFVVAAIGWGAASRVMDGAGSALEVGLAGFSRNSPILTLLLSIGPVLLPALVAVVLRPAGPEMRRAATIGMAGIAAGLFLLYFVRISEASWVGFRAGQVLLVSIPVLLARTLAALRPRARAGLVVLVLAAGLPTTIIDTFNAQDIGNRRPGPGFRWTLWTTPDQAQAFAWIRAHTAPGDIVQMEPMVRGREHWTLIPSFAGRRMAAGLPISLLPIPEYQARSAQVQRLFATAHPAEAHALARRLRIDYVYVDRDDDMAYPEGTRKFDTYLEGFTRVFANGTVRVYRVR